jgi:thiol-disulfide isomerase/thioredoxin
MLTTGGDSSPLAALDGAPVWLNSKPLTDEGLRGRVVLVDFWTYSCVNWLRTLPYVRAWFQRYAQRGLVVIGVHAPEFSFEHDLDNVHQAVEHLDIGYPVVIDNEFAIWRSFENHYWPALYLLDGTGVVRFHHFGEEAYGEIERTTQRLLGVQEGLVHVDAGGVAEPAQWRSLHSEETYLGDSRGERRVDADAWALALNQWSLRGQWSIHQEAAVLGADGSIAYCFQGRDLNMVLTPPVPGGSVRFIVHLDGEPPGVDHGLDVNPSGFGTVSAPRMYQLVRVQPPIRRRTFEITFLDPGVHAYVFTFG